MKLSTKMSLIFFTTEVLIACLCIFFAIWHATNSGWGLMILEAFLAVAWTAFAVGSYRDFNVAKHALGLAATDRPASEK